MLTILFNSILSSFILISSGFFLKKKKKLEVVDICEIAFFGAIFLSFISIALNFILPINRLLSNIVFISLIILFILSYKNFYNLKNICVTILCTGCITSLILTLDNIYRPDAGLYHLPYTNIINENNIIIGLANIHFRFGHISVIQYLNAIFNNQILGTHGILLPTATIFSYFLVYLIQEIKNNFDKKIFGTFIFLIFTYTLYGYNRYSEFGNDATAHIYLFLVFIFFLKEFDKENIKVNLINKLLLLSIFSFLQKTTMLIGIFIPLYCYFFLKDKIKVINFTNFFSFLFVLIWLIKNILISGCLIYPISITCFDKLNWYSNEKNYQISAPYQSLENESWSKGWPDKKDQKLNFDEYNNIIIGLRFIKTIENVISARYIFRNNLSLSIRGRHYWTGGYYKSFYNLSEDGYLIDNISYSQNHDFNFNAFNVDMVFQWQFAPGSSLNLVWKNSIYNESGEVIKSYSRNFNNTLDANQLNVVSLKVLYYFDYLYLRKKRG